VLPGERLTPETLAYVQRTLELGGSVRGASGPPAAHRSRRHRGPMTSARGAPRYTGVRTFGRPRSRSPRRARRPAGRCGRRRRAVRHGHELAPRRALWTRGDPLGLVAAAPLAPASRRRGVRRTHGARRRRRLGHTRQRRAPRPSRSPLRWGRCASRRRRRWCSAATTRSCSASCARKPLRTAHSPCCCSTRTPTHGTTTTVSACFTGR